MTLSIQSVPGFAGDVVQPGSAHYDSVRQIFNGLIDKRPNAVLRCRSRADIVAAVRYAVGSGAEIAVRCSGHSVAGHSSSEGGIVIDLSLLAWRQGISPDRIMYRARNQLTALRIAGSIGPIT